MDMSGLPDTFSLYGCRHHTSLVKYFLSHLTNNVYIYVVNCNTYLVAYRIMCIPIYIRSWNAYNYPFKYAAVNL